MPVGFASMDSVVGNTGIVAEVSEIGMYSESDTATAEGGVVVLPSMVEGHLRAVDIDRTFLASVGSGEGDDFPAAVDELCCCKNTTA